MEVYDSGPGSADYYTVIDSQGDVFTMSANADSPLGVNQYAGKVSELPGARDGELLSWDEVPEEVRAAIQERS